jgi:hypothetical protein
MSDSEGVSVQPGPLESKPDAPESERSDAGVMSVEPGSLVDQSERMSTAPAAKARGRPFSPGTSGNPNGRPKGARNKVTLAAEALLEGEAEALTRKLIDKAKEGDIGALRFCLERICPIRRDRLVTIDIPEIGSVQDASRAAAAILGACAAGEISTNDAANLIGLIGDYVRLIEVGEIEQRLRALEAAGGSP